MDNYDYVLFVIPARGGSKGVPGKNIKPLGGKPLIYYSIDIARLFVPDDQICVSTDDMGIKEVVESYQLKVPFTRPSALASDTAGSYEVLLHALEHYKKRGKHYTTLVLLQPTSPFRTTGHVSEALNMFNSECDMVVSVVESVHNPYYNLFEENEAGFLNKSKHSNYTRRQDCPKVYAYNGAVYVINIDTLLKKPLHQFDKVKKIEMDELSSTDIDTQLDWKWAEFLISNKIVNL